MSAPESAQAPIHPRIDCWFRESLVTLPTYLFVLTRNPAITTDMLPDWAPNIHPLIVHFPIALLFTAAAVDTVGMFMRSNDFLRKGAFSLYLLGSLGVVAAWFSGRQAGDSVFLPTEANVVLTEHADLGQYLLIFFGVYAVIRLIMFGLSLESRTALRGVVWIVGLVGIGLTWVTADHGAELVFKHGAGVQAAQVEALVFTLPDSSETSGPVMNDEGGWTLKPTRAAVWLDDMTVYGNADGLVASLQDGGERGDVLALTVEGDPVMIVFDHSMASVQIDAPMNLDRFDGTLMMVTHVQDEENYYFTSFSDESVRQGVSESGDLILMDNQDYTPAGWVTYRAVADQTHFRAYADQQMIAHGHGADGGTGPVGIRLNGTGTVLIDYIQTASLRPGQPH